MKKLLALVLALVMTLGLATVSSNAATLSDLKDADTISDEYKEAATVVNAIDVMVGDDQGFRPTDKLTRAEGAKIAAYLIATNKVASELQGNGQKFTDVPANFWNGNGSGMIEYCAVNGIIAGVGNNKFDPNGALTAAAFAKMMLTALKYDAKIEGYVGADWATNVMVRAQRVGLMAGLEDVKPTDQITREQAAQMVFNTLKTPLVEYASKGNTMNINGAEVSFGTGDAKPVTNEALVRQTIYANKVNATNNANGAFVVEFAEEYYPKLVLTPSTNVWGEPSRVWTYERKELGNWTNTDYFVKTYTTATTGATVYSDIGALAYGEKRLNYDKQVWVDGLELTADTNPTLASVTDLIKQGGTTLGVTGQGVETSLFVNDEAGYARLVIKNTWLAKVIADYDASGKSLTLGVYEDWDAPISRVAKSSNIDGLDGYKLNDFVLVQMTLPGTTSYTVRSVKAAESLINATASAYTTDSNKKMSTITLDGDTKKVAAKTYWLSEILKDYSQEKLKGFTYDVYLDNYGNVIGINYNKQDTNYVFVVSTDTKGSNIYNTSFTAKMIFMDGTMSTETVTVNKNMTTATKDILTGANLVGGTPNTGNPTVNAWFQYSKADNGAITLVEMPGNTAGTYRQYAQRILNKEDVAEVSASQNTLKTNAAATAFAYGNEKSVYITVDVDKDTTYVATNAKGAIKDVTNVTTGIKNTSIEVAQVNTLPNFAASTVGNEASANAFYLYSGVYVLAAVVIGTDAGAARNFVYVTDYIGERSYSGRYIDTYSAIVDGKEIDLKVDSQKTNSTNLNSKLATDVLHQVVFDKDDVVIDLKNETRTATATNQGLAIRTADTLNTNANKVAGYVYTTTADKVTYANETFTINASGDNACYVIVAKTGVEYFVKNPSSGAYQNVQNAESAIALAHNTDANNKTRKIIAVSAVIDPSTGFAKTVIIDTNYTGTNTKGQGTDGATVVYDDASGLFTNPLFYNAYVANTTTGAHKTLTVGQMANALIEAMQKKGYVDISYNAGNGTLTWKESATSTVTLSSTPNFKQVAKVTDAATGTVYYREPTNAAYDSYGEATKITAANGWATGATASLAGAKDLNGAEKITLINDYTEYTTFSTENATAVATDFVDYTVGAKKADTTNTMALETLLAAMEDDEVKMTATVFSTEYDGAAGKTLNIPEGSTLTIVGNLTLNDAGNADTINVLGTLQVKGNLKSWAHIVVGGVELVSGKDLPGSIIVTGTAEIKGASLVLDGTGVADLRGETKVTGTLITFANAALELNGKKLVLDAGDIDDLVVDLAGTTNAKEIEITKTSNGAGESVTLGGNLSGVLTLDSDVPTALDAGSITIDTLTVKEGQTLKLDNGAAVNVGTLVLEKDAVLDVDDATLVANKTTVSDSAFVDASDADATVNLGATVNDGTVVGNGDSVTLTKDSASTGSETGVNTGSKEELKVTKVVFNVGSSREKGSYVTSNDSVTITFNKAVKSAKIGVVSGETITMGGSPASISNGDTTATFKITTGASAIGDKLTVNVSAIVASDTSEATDSKSNYTFVIKSTQFNGELSVTVTKDKAST